jgi:hypothetical protein
MPKKHLGTIKKTSFRPLVLILLCNKEAPEKIISLRVKIMAIMQFNPILIYNPSYEILDFRCYLRKLMYLKSLPK